MLKDCMVIKNQFNANIALKKHLDVGENDILFDFHEQTIDIKELDSILTILAMQQSLPNYLTLKFDINNAGVTNEHIVSLKTGLGKVKWSENTRISLDLRKNNFDTEGVQNLIDYCKELPKNITIEIDLTENGGKYNIDSDIIGIALSNIANSQICDDSIKSNNVTIIFDHSIIEAYCS